MKLKNESFDGSPVEFQMDSPLLVAFDPLALDQLSALMLHGEPLDSAELLERANSDYSAVACYAIPNFRPGVFTLDPRDIKSLGDEDDFDYDEDERELESADGTSAFPFFAVDSATLVLADAAHLPKLLTLLTWEEFDRSLRDDSVLPNIIAALGGPYFAVIGPDSSAGMQFDGDGTYTIAPESVRRVGIHQ